MGNHRLAGNSCRRFVSTCAWGWLAMLLISSGCGPALSGGSSGNPTNTPPATGGFLGGGATGTDDTGMPGDDGNGTDPDNPDDMTPDDGSTELGGCFAVHDSPGCDTLSCNDAVCAMQSECCDVAGSGWTSGCVELAIALREPSGECVIDDEVEDTNTPPFADIAAVNQFGTAPLTVSLSASRSTDAETAAGDLIYQWDFGNGVTENDAGTPGVSVTTFQTYVLDTDGNLCTTLNPCFFTVTLTVTDEGGMSGTDQVQVFIGQ